MMEFNISELLKTKSKALEASKKYIDTAKKVINSLDIDKMDISEDYKQSIRNALADVEKQERKLKRLKKNANINNK